MNESNELEPDPLLEAAWYALIPYINPIDCSKNTMMTTKSGASYACPIPLNTNAQLENFYMGKQINGKNIKPFWFSKKLLAAHLNGNQTFYYRSRPNGIAREGYGSSDNAWKRLGAAADVLGITGRCRKVPASGVILACADIDCHNGEQDVALVRDWLLEHYFPGSYCEPSTNGRGVHLYLKISYYPYALKDHDKTLRHVINVVSQLACLLDDERRKLGFDAPLDKLRGLPSLFAWTGSGLCIQRGGCIKIPRFSAGVSDVVAFHQAPAFEFSAIETLLSQLRPQPLGGLRTSPASVASSDGLAKTAVLDAAYGWEIAARTCPKASLAGGVLPHNSAYPSYELQMKSLRNQTDAFSRTHGFALAYSRNLGRVPRPTEALAEYEQQGLSTGADRSGIRAARMEYVLDFVARTFDSGKGLSGFEEHRTSLICEITESLAGHAPPSYRKAKGRPMATPSLDDIALVLFALRRSQGERDATQYGLRKVQDAFKRIRGQGCGRDKANCIMKALKTLGLITKIAGPIPGKRGSLFRVKRSFSNAI